MLCEVYSYIISYSMVKVLIIYTNTFINLTTPGCKEDTVIPQFFALLCNAYIVIIYVDITLTILLLDILH